jgi:F-type H+-transporting ATPase subunit gamma
MTGDQGLAGAYNLNVINTAETYIREKERENVEKGLSTDTRLYVCGTIGKDRLIRSGFEVDRDFNYPIASASITCAGHRGLCRRSVRFRKSDLV